MPLDPRAVVVGAVLLAVVGLFVVAPPPQTGLKPMVTLTNPSIPTSVELPALVSTLLGMTTYQSTAVTTSGAVAQQTTTSTPSTISTATPPIGCTGPIVSGSPYSLMGSVTSVYDASYWLEVSITVAAGSPGIFSSGQTVRLWFEEYPDRPIPPGTSQTFGAYSLKNADQISAVVRFIDSPPCMGSYPDHWQTHDDEWEYILPLGDGSSRSITGTVSSLTPVEGRVDAVITAEHGSSLIFIIGQSYTVRFYTPIQFNIGDHVTVNVTWHMQIGVPGYWQGA